MKNKRKSRWDKNKVEKSALTLIYIFLFFMFHCSIYICRGRGLSIFVPLTFHTKSVPGCTFDIFWKNTNTALALFFTCICRYLNPEKLYHFGILYRFTVTYMGYNVWNGFIVKLFRVFFLCESYIDVFLLFNVFFFLFSKLYIYLKRKDLNENFWDDWMFRIYISAITRPCQIICNFHLKYKKVMF